MHLAEALWWPGEPERLPVAGCVTVFQGPNETDALSAFGAAMEDDFHGTEATPVVHIAGLPSGGWLVTEDVTFAQGVNVAVVRRASRTGRAASVYWDVNGLVLLRCARSGRSVCAEDVSGPATDLDVPATLRRVFLRAEESGESALVAALFAAQMFARVEVPRTVAPMATHRVIRPALELRYAEWVVDRDDAPTPAIATAARSASPRTLRLIARWAATRAVETADIADVWAVRTSLALLDETHASRLPSAVLPILDEADRRSFAAEVDLSEPDDPDLAERELRLWSRRYWALQALAHAFHDDPVVAALGTLECLAVMDRGLAEASLALFG